MRKPKKYKFKPGDLIRNSSKLCEFGLVTAVNSSEIIVMWQGYESCWDTDPEECIFVSHFPAIARWNKLTEIETAVMQAKQARDITHLISRFE